VLAVLRSQFKGRSAATAVFESVRDMLQGGDELELEFPTVGYRPMPEDGFPIIGRVQGALGLYVAVMHSGITLAPATGRFVADELLNGRRDALLSSFGFERFR
jgi:glycine/D-amino acid oxidase-like deaminating enzyme